MSIRRGGQDDLTRQQRLNDGGCPTHGLHLVMGETLADAQVFDCPRADCSFSIIPKRGTKCFARLYPRMDRTRLK